MAKKNESNAWLWIGLLVAAGGIYWGGHAAGWFGGEKLTEIKGAKVKRGPMTISVLQRGNLSAKDAVSIKSEIEGQATILTLIAEGTLVKPGDLLCELDASDLIEKRIVQEISVQNADATYTKAKAQYEIQESQNKSDIEAAERKLKFAELDLKKYQKGDYEQQLKEAADKILLAESKKSQSENTFNWSKNLADKGFLTKTELDKDSLDYQSSGVQLDQAKVSKELFEKYDDPRKRTELDANLKEAERGLERAGLKATAMIADYKAGLLTSEAKLTLEREKLQKYVDQIAKARIKSPVEGMVVYSRVEGGGRMGMETPIQEGAQIRERQEILQIPRTGGMIVEASVHESVLKLVSAGMPCRVTIDALPGLQFPGEVQTVAVLPDKGSWWANPNTRLYKTNIVIRAIENPSKEYEVAYADMRPGMSCGIEILSAEIADCLYVPVQCIVLTRGETIAFVSGANGPIETRVKVGRSNEKFVEVLEGLKEGDEVLLAPPTGFVPMQAEEKLSDMPKSAASGNAQQLNGANAGAGGPMGAAGAAPGTLKPGGADGKPGGGGDGTANGPGNGGGRGRRGGGDPAQMEEMRKKMESMTPEEKEKFREQMRQGRKGPPKDGETKPADAAGSGGGK